MAESGPWQLRPGTQARQKQPWLDNPAPDAYCCGGCCGCAGCAGWAGAGCSGVVCCVSSLEHWLADNPVNAIAATAVTKRNLLMVMSPLLGKNYQAAHKVSPLSCRQLEPGA
jgi:hypothetical protein